MTEPKCFKNKNLTHFKLNYLVRIIDQKIQNLYLFSWRDDPLPGLTLVLYFKILAMERFLENILKKGDVYLLTVSQVIEWIQHPVKLDKINDFKPWRCD